MAIDPSTLEYQYRYGAGAHSGQQQTTYAVNFSSNGKDYTFIPDSVINKGVKYGDETYVMPWFLNKDNLNQLGKIGQKVDLAGQSWYGDYLKDTVGASTTGVLVPSGSIPFDSKVSVIPGDIQGMGEANGQLVYSQPSTNGQVKYVTPDGSTQTITPGKSDGGLFGGFFGDIVNPVVNTAADIWNSLGPVGQLAAAYYGGSAISDALGAGAAAPEIAAAPEVAAAGDFSGALPAGSAYVAPEVGAGTQLASLAPATATDAGAVAADAAAADAGAKLGLQGSSTALGNIGGDLATGTGSLIPDYGTAAAGAAAGAAGAAGAGTALSSILPYTAGAGLVGSILQSNAAQNAANTQSAAAQQAIAQQQANFNTINAQQAPYRAAGYNALNDIANLTTGQTPQYDANGNVVKDANGNPVMTTGSGYLQHQFNAADLTAGLAPNYDFMLQQGQMANQRAANAGGGALGGNALQGLNKYTQDYAGNAYQNAFNNYQNQRTGIYNTLASIAGIGQTGQNATNTAATNATNAATQLGVGSAAAQSAATTGSAQAYTNAINNASNNYTLASLLNQRGNVTMPVQG